MAQAATLVTPDRDTKWSDTVRLTLAAAVVHTPYRAPSANVYAERFVRSIKEECLDRLLILGEAHLRHALREFATHITKNEITKASTIS